MKNFTIRKIKKQDNTRVKEIIHKVMPEFGACGEGFAIVDPEVDDMYGKYNLEKSIYYVLLNSNQEVVGGAGIGPLAGSDSKTCELKKMYFLNEVRGTGFGKKMLTQCLETAKEFGYTHCYLETLEHMYAAKKLYEKVGFRKLNAPMGNTGHFGCDAWYVLEL